MPRWSLVSRVLFDENFSFPPNWNLIAYVTTSNLRTSCGLIFHSSISSPSRAKLSKSLLEVGRVNVLPQEHIFRRNWNVLRIYISYAASPRNACCRKSWRHLHKLSTEICKTLIGWNVGVETSASRSSSQLTNYAELISTFPQIKSDEARTGFKPEPGELSQTITRQLRVNEDGDDDNWKTRFQSRTINSISIIAVSPCWCWHSSRSF